MIRTLQSTEDMIQCGAEVAAEVRAGDCFALVGNLGAGKTHWTQGLVRGLGSDEVVTSPTFGLAHEYHGGRLTVCHLDFHRIESEQELIDLGWDEILDSYDVVVAEWADKFPRLMPPGARWLRFEVVSDSERGIRDSEAPLSMP